MQGLTATTHKNLLSFPLSIKLDSSSQPSLKLGFCSGEKAPPYQKIQFSESP